ncbi:MAG: DUF3795 domain-containing protein [Desulfovibrio sp.]|uniref:DUF3795 domain-containing protein n=1 Tax=Desulfovibrio sp. 7SRBS1 TaxID=3378064 RepID=UPI003B3FC254
MQREELLQILAPCGLDCARCLSRAGGAIQQASKALVAGLGGFDKLAPRFANMNAVFEQYKGFQAVVEFLASGSCTGCRSGGCLNGSCGVKDCIREMGVDFCYECAEFPCDRSNLSSGLRDRWEQMNRRMKEIGEEAYLEETTRKPRY